MGTLLAALAAVALLAPAASAADPQIMDDRGDANGLNNQGVVPADLTVSLPAGADSYDLLSVRFTTVKQGRKVTGFTASMLVGMAPGPGSQFLVKASAPGCADIWLEYVVDALGAAEGRLRHACVPDVAALEPRVWGKLDTVANGTTVRFTVPLAALPKGVGAGTVLGDLRAESRVLAVAASPVLVDAAAGTTYRIGS